MTEEQQNIIDTVISSESDNRIVAIQALAGTGKTYISQQITKTLKPDKGFYTAFNKGIVRDSAYKFKTLLEAKTIHSLAYRYINPSKVKDFTYDMITEKIPYSMKKEVITQLDKFFRSPYLTYEEFFHNSFIEPHIEHFIMKYGNLMVNGKMPVTFNYLLKTFHIMLDEGSINPKYDLFILDECQDSSAVTLEIFKLINSKKKVMLGDPYQNIYSFLDTVNGFNLIQDTLFHKLSKCFRCTLDIAKQIEEFGKNTLSSDFKFVGNEELTEPKNNECVYLNLTNSDLIMRMYNLMEEGKGFTCIRTLDEIFALPLSIVYAASGKKIFDSKFKFIQDERLNWLADNQGKTFFQYLNSLGLDEVSSAINTLNKFNKQNINIFNLKEQLKKVKPSKSITLSTAHSFKGLERTNAIIEKNLTDKLPSKDSQVNNLYYVAISRAMFHLTYL